MLLLLEKLNDIINHHNIIDTLLYAIIIELLSELIKQPKLILQSNPPPSTSVLSVLTSHSTLETWSTTTTVWARTLPIISRTNNVWTPSLPCMLPFPSSANVFFTTESDREYNLAKAIIRPYSTLIFAQGIMIWRARKIHDGEIKRVFVLAYFICFLFSTLSLIAEHLTNSGVVSGKIMGVMKIVSMMLLTAGYGWFTFFQPPAVFSGLATHYH